MGVFRDSISGLKPVIFVAWFVAAGRLAIEASTTDLNFVAMLSVYSAIVIIFLFAGITGQLDGLVWKRLLVGSLVLGIACFGIPNTISYTVAQFQGWNHGRFYSDAEFAALQTKHMDEDGTWIFSSNAKTAEELKRESASRGPPIGRTNAEKFKHAYEVGGLTTIAGTLWSLLWGTLFVGIPATVRRRRRAA